MRSSSVHWIGLYCRSALSHFKGASKSPRAKRKASIKALEMQKQEIFSESQRMLRGNHFDFQFVSHVIFMHTSYFLNL